MSEQEHDLQTIIEYVIQFIEFNMEEWYEFSMIDDETGELIALEFDTVAKRLGKLAQVTA